VRFQASVFDNIYSVMPSTVIKKTTEEFIGDLAIPSR
jgi:hypothetical protein